MTSRGSTPYVLTKQLFQGDFEGVCKTKSIFFPRGILSVCGDSRNEVTCLTASLTRQILYRCKSAAVPWSHLLLCLLMVHAPSCPPRMARSSRTNSGVIASRRKKTAKKGSSLGEDKSKSGSFLFLEGKQSYDAKTERQEYHKTSDQGWMGSHPMALFPISSCHIPATIGDLEKTWGNGYMNSLLKSQGEFSLLLLCLFFTTATPLIFTTVTQL